MKNLLFAISFIFSSYCISQTYEPTAQSNPALDFDSYLRGVRYAYVALDEEQLNVINSYPNGGSAYGLSGLISYLKEIGFEEVKYGLNTSPPIYPSLCQLTIVSPSWTYSNNAYRDIKLTFSTCVGDDFTFNATRNIPINGYVNISLWFHNTFLKMYGAKKGLFHPNSSIVLKSNITDINEEKFKHDIIQNGADPIEGIYENTFNSSQMSKYKVGIIKKDDSYTIIYFSGAENYLDWKEGEVKAKLYATATPTLFKADWTMMNKKVNSDAIITFEQGFMNVLIKGQDKVLYIKLFPTSKDIISASKGLKSGSGFGLTSNGLIVTNSHVVNEAKEIKVRGINGDFDHVYKAKIVIDDRNNDLAVIKIEDLEFKTLGVIPFTINVKPKEVGSSIYVMGYPLRATMGDEIKLTTGIISSNSGFQGDVTTYQISAPVQPGNSGGPLFDEKGNLIGVVNSKHLQAENASYAIKTSYLFNLLDLLPSPPKLQTISLVSGKSLTEQIKYLKKFIYIIEVN